MPGRFSSGGGSRRRREALNNVAKMMFTDQRWVDFVPSFFEHHILKDPAYNVAYWNLHARDLTWDGSRYMVDGAPMRFFHFSGFEFEKPWLLSRHQGERPRILLSERPALGTTLSRICCGARWRLASRHLPVNRTGGARPPPACRSALASGGCIGRL